MGEGMGDDLIEVYRAGGLPEAHALRLRLEAEGVSATVVNELLQGAVGELPLGWATAPRVAVRRSDEAAARAILAAFLARPRAAGDDRCLACGAEMPGADTCPACGWSYAGRPVPDTPVDGPAPAGPAEVPEPDVPAAEATGVGRRMLWAELLAVLAVGVLPHLAAAVVTAIDPLPPRPFRADAGYGLVLDVCAIVAVLYIVRRAPEGWAGFGVIRPRAVDLVTGVGLLGVSMAAVRLTAGLPPDALPPGPAYPAPGGAAEVVLAIARNLASALSEELVTRAYLITRLAVLLRSHGEAVFAAAVLFASYHLNQGLPGLAMTFLMGLGYGAAFLILRRVWPLAIGHAAYNTLLDLSAV